VRRTAEQDLQREIGRRIRRARLALDLTQEAAAARADLDWRRWQRLEAGEVNATVRTLARVAEALGTTFWKLLYAAPLSRAR
jgi:transcriptional regulator with XRE-family HTH domain